MELLDFYPAMGSFTPGEPIRLIFELRAEEPAEDCIHLAITHLADTVAEFEIPVSLKSGNHEITHDWYPIKTSPRGFGAAAYLAGSSAEHGEPITTAFDVLETWTNSPRYGFLCDFRPGRKDVERILDALLKYHINGLQFYDWQYRHDQLIPPQPEYLDPLGRPSSLKTINDFIAAAHQRRMAAMPYLAVYAASKEFAQSHPSWALYDEKGSPYFFEDFLGLMDPSPKSPWTLHLLDQCRQILEKLPFDGFHVDQYGDPRSGFSITGSSVDLPTSFAGLVNALKAQHPNEAITFNAVKGWPIDALAATPLDFLYIELWPSTPYYRDLIRIVSEARAKSGCKPLVIALYLPANRPINIRLVDALILAGGATRIELGESERLLADPYFPKHEEISDDLKQVLRAYSDFAVRYGELIGPHAEDLVNLTPSLPDGIWSLARKAGGWIVINLINTRGLEKPLWTEPHPPPEKLTNFAIPIYLEGEIQQVYCASPDSNDPALMPVAWRSDGPSLEVQIPQLEFWTMILIETTS